MTEQPIQLDIPSLSPEPISLAGKDRWILGSDPERADLVLSSLEVAGVHCVLSLKGGKVHVTDLGSDLGSQLDGKSITQGTLAPGQRLDVGPVSIWLSQDSTGSDLPSIPGYEFVREIGRGSGGYVYLATQTSLQRQVAIKVLAPALSHDPELVRRFESEARAAAALGHSNVVTVFDVGSKDSTHYLSMEYMSEGSLADRLEKRGPLSWRQTLRMIADTCEALAFAESRDLVHRDIKPANLMLTETGVTKLADLGLVMDLSQDHAAGPAMGTPHFLAPEVVSGKKPSPQSDLYSLGATAYQVATGSTPFQGATSKEILRAALTTEPETPHQKDPEIPAAVSQLILDLMAKDPAHRPQSAAQVLERVDRLELQLGLPAMQSAGGGRRWAMILAGPILLGVGYLVWAQSHPLDPVPETQSGTTTRKSVSQETAPDTVGEPSFQFNDVRATPDAEGTPANAGADFELEAQERFKAIQASDFSDSERISKLREFAQAFRGSNSADGALTLAGNIEERGRSAARAVELEALVYGTEIELLNNLAGWDRDNDPLLPVLQGLLAYETTLLGAPLKRFSVARKNALTTLIASADDHLQIELAEAQSKAEHGDFDAGAARMGSLLEGLQPVTTLDLSQFHVDGTAPIEILDFQERFRACTSWVESLPELEIDWGVQTRSHDRSLLGEQLGRASELRKELLSLDIKQARKRLSTAQKAMLSEPGRGWVASIDRDLANMETYLAAWRASYAEGAWSHTTTLDPRSSRPNNVGVSGVHSNWVSLDGVRVPLTDFMERERDFRNLFEGRIKTPLKPQEKEGLAALYRLQAVLAVLDRVQEMLVTSEAARFTEGEVQEVGRILLRAKIGQTEQGLKALAVEERTAQSLVAGLLAYSIKDFGTAAGYFEQTFDTGRGSLLLMLLSDGRSLPLNGSLRSAVMQTATDE